MTPARVSVRFSTPAPNVRISGDAARDATACGDQGPPPAACISATAAAAAAAGISAAAAGPHAPPPPPLPEGCRWCQGRRIYIYITIYIYI